jgi:hypothetical protein
MQRNSAPNYIENIHKQAVKAILSARITTGTYPFPVCEAKRFFSLFTAPRSIANIGRVADCRV